MLLSLIRTGQTDEIPQTADLFIGACGYESRATCIAAQVCGMAKRKLAYGFEAQHELHYNDNRRWFVSNGFEVMDVSDEQFGIEVFKVINQVAKEGNAVTVVVDISCTNRARLARLIRILQTSEIEAIDVSFAYNLAQFSLPPRQEAPTTVAEPVIPEFAGWTNYPERPPSAILGLGYERSRAIGIVDHLEINNATWAFVPRGPIHEYSASVDAANRSLFDMIGVEGRRSYYDVMNPGSLFREMNALVDSLKQIYNPILIPFGPKIFALVSLLVACVHPSVGVWRVSSGALEPAVDRKPSLHTTVLRTRFGE